MERITYRKSGVDIKKANRMLEDIKPLIASTNRNGSIGNIGAFAGFFKCPTAGMKQPLIVASTDGVGTKLVVAQKAKRHDTIGIDLVAMCVNDLVTCGAEPLFFLDYFASGKLTRGVMHDVLKGIVAGCKEAHVALIGGETAELPGMYAQGVYDIAGFSVGVVDKKEMIDGSKIKPGDLIIGIQSNGIHSNGYSLVRKVFPPRELKGALLKEVLRPTIIYVRPVLDLKKQIQVKGIANITGGGLFDNVIRILPAQAAAIIFKRAWEVPEIFTAIQKKGHVENEEMFRTFNMGIGMVLVVARESAWKAKRILSDTYNLTSWLIGEVIKGKRRVELIDS